MQNFRKICSAVPEINCAGRTDVRTHARTHERGLSESSLHSVSVNNKAREGKHYMMHQQGYAFNWNVISRRNRMFETTYHITLVGGCVCACVRGKVTVYLGNRWTYFPEILPKIRRKKKENFAQGPIFYKKWLKITILISAYRRILPFLLVIIILIHNI